jgi:hypothetical protein
VFGGGEVDVVVIGGGRLVVVGGTDVVETVVVLLVVGGAWVELGMVGVLLGGPVGSAVELVAITNSWRFRPGIFLYRADMLALACSARYARGCNA